MNPDLRLALLFLVYLGGIGLYWLNRADHAVRNPSTTITRKRDWLAYYLVPLLYRTAFDVAFFLGWAIYPDLFFGYINKWVGTNIQIPLNILTACLAGLLVDVLLDMAIEFLAARFPWFTRFTKQVPVIPEVQQALAALPQGK